MLLNAGLGPDFRIHHIRTNVNRRNSEKGRLSFANLVALFLLWLRLVAAIVKYRPRVVYAFLSQNATGFIRDAVIILTAWIFRTSIVVQFHGGNFGNFYAHAGTLWQSLIRFVIGRLNCLLLLADRFRPQFQGLVPAERIHVMRNPVDLASFDRVECSRNSSNGVFTILFVGLLSPAKGFVDLLRAVPRVLECVPDARFLFAGEWLESERNILFGESGQRLDFDPRVVRDLWENACRRYGSQLKYLGIISGEEKNATFKSADVFVLPSYSEGLPMAVLEAMAASLPVVVTPVGALPEILEAEVNAKFVPCGDAEVLAQALIDLARNPVVRRHMGIANRRLVETRFTPGIVSAQLAEILREIVHSR